MEETNRSYPDGCPTGSAVVSGAGNLPARYVIHAVGPVWSGGQRGEEALLRGAYRTALQLAAEHGCRSVALPALSTGAYRYPIPAAARVAIESAAEFLKELPGNEPPQLVRFVLFSADVLAIFEQALEEATAEY
jgi:O-acetyl-ADP-ribose deacetylase